LKFADAVGSAAGEGDPWQMGNGALRWGYLR